jgi:sterol 3beta-glucosyltransferase
MSVGMSRVSAVRVYLVTMGSRGDHEPFRALAYEAAAAGHEVYFSHTTDLPTDDDAPYQELSLPGSFGALIGAQGTSVFKALLSYKRVIQPMLESMYQEATNQIRDIKPDVVLYHPKVLTAAVAAHSVGALAVIVEMFPTLTPTREFAAAGIPAHLPGWLNKASFRLVKAGLTAIGDPGHALAKELGVVHETPDLTLCPVSPSLVPQPADWPDHALITGHWAMPQPGPKDTELRTFLSKGPVLYAGFGSMNDGKGATRARAIVSAARSLGMKTLLVTGWGGLESSLEHYGAEDVLVRQSVSHTDVVPHITVAIHHGGAGTTHQMLAAGVPSVIMPFLADQPWWAARLADRGLGPKPLPRRTRRVEKIVAAITQAMDATDAVRAVSKQIAVEDGLGKALSLIEAAEMGQQSLASS